MENNNNFSFAICRLPHASEILFFEGICNVDYQLSETKAGTHFLASEFNNPNKIIGIPFKKIGTSSEIQFPNKAFQRENFTIETTQEFYESMVKEAVNNIQLNHYQKIVLASNKSIPLLRFEPKPFLLALMDKYPAAFVYCVSTPSTGTWFGATPEQLLQKKNNVYKTVALAGTKAAEDAHSAWGEKEIQEQKWVEIYIDEILKSLACKVSKSKVETIQSGNLLHLCTQFEFETTNQAIDIKILLEKLSPTPAVAGLPKEIALKQIQKLENFERSNYAGFIGIHSNENVQLFVNLRCMEWHAEVATLYAGAGITGSSIPQAEWVETRRKMFSLEQFLQDKTTQHIG